MQKVLVVEDDKELNQGIVYSLENAGYKAMGVFSLAQAKENCRKEKADLVLLDVNLPDGEGFDFCRWLKEKQKTPVLFLTARDLEEDALKGYELGAEDYVTKPFSIKILLEKIRIIFERNEKKTDIFEDGFLRIDFCQAKVWVKEEECAITPTEFRMLRFFTENRGILLTYEALLEKLWDATGAFVDKHTLAVNVNRLRGKIEDDTHKYISNVYGMGYQWIK